MLAYEYYTEIMSDGHLSIPDDIKIKIENSKRIKVVVMIDETEKTKNKKLSDILLNSPLRDSGIDLERKDDFGRDIELWNILLILVLYQSLLKKIQT